MRTYLTVAAAVAALAWPLPAIPAATQETTIEEALEYLQRGERVNGVSAHEPAVHILRQVDRRGGPSPRTSAELDALADRLAEIAADATLPDHVRKVARFALAGAAGTEWKGTPYPRAFDLLVQVYEGGYDHALYTIWRTDSVRGLAYMRELFERSERPALLCRWVHVDGEWKPVIGGFYPPAPLPPQCDDHHWRDDHYTPWCQAGGYLFGGIVAEAWEPTPGGKRRGTGYGPAPVPDGLPEHVEDWHRRCR